jgi:hypothetical protein
VPFLLSTGDRGSPIEEITEVSEDLAWSAHFRFRAKISERIGRTAERLAGAISKRRDGVAKQLTARISNAQL